MRRPSEEVARKAIFDFLCEMGRFEHPEDGGDLAPEDIRMCENGDDDSAPNKCGWAFFLDYYDTTSYLKEDLTVEWYGSKWQVDS